MILQPHAKSMHAFAPCTALRLFAIGCITLSIALATYESIVLPYVALSQMFQHYLWCEMANSVGVMEKWVISHSA